MKAWLCGILLALTAGVSLAGEVTVTALTAQQRYPWNGKMDLAVTLSGTAEDVAKVDCIFTATNGTTHAALPVTHLEKVGADAGAGTSWTRHYVWDAGTDLGAVKIDDIALSVRAEILGGVQLWEGGPYWAECNVGANKPEEYGYYFWWGDTVGYTRDGGWWTDGYYYSGVTWVSSSGEWMSLTPFDSSMPTYNKTVEQLKSMGYVDASGNLTAAHDAATAHLGAPWRMPTDSEFSALVKNCDMMLTTQNGVYGRLVKGRGAYASKSIFLPAAGHGYDSRHYYTGSGGYYWSSTPNSDISISAWFLSFGSGGFDRSYYVRCVGQSVRPVRGFAR